MADFRVGKRGGLVVDRESLHASPEYARQIAALERLQGHQPMNADVEKAVEASRSPRVDALIERVMQKYPGVSASAQARYYEAVHQELAPLARNQEAEISRLRARAEKDAAMLRKCRQFVAWATERLPEAVPVYDELNAHLGGEHG